MAKMEWKDFWTRRKLEELCNMWEAKPSLYNPKVREYHDRWCRKHDSEEIAQTLGTTGHEVLKKIKNLKTQYAREQRKAASARSGSGEVSLSKWYLLPLLKFLDVLIDSSPKAAHLGGYEIPDHNSTHQAADEINVEVSEDKHDVSEEDRDAKRPRLCLPKRPTNSDIHVRLAHDRKRIACEKTFFVTAASYMKSLSDNIEKAKRVSQDDAFDIFGKYVASELRLMEDAQMQKMAKLRIQQVLIDVQSSSTKSQLPVPVHVQPPCAASASDSPALSVGPVISSEPPFTNNCAETDIKLSEMEVKILDHSYPSTFHYDT
ncbi:uncharacterized protein LOC136753233 [Amia ocellicauda]|uniref:uncharacterized protein LOC136753233 n=1 Tax=Amia ocellicauda TaxID=2972642 RepID=UPI003464D3FB